MSNQLRGRVHTQNVEIEERSLGASAHLPIYPFLSISPVGEQGARGVCARLEEEGRDIWYYLSAWLIYGHLAG